VDFVGRWAAVGRPELRPPGTALEELPPEEQAWWRAFWKNVEEGRKHIVVHVKPLKPQPPAGPGEPPASSGGPACDDPLPRIRKETEGDHR
jgi:hypothetical protein